MLCTDVVHNTLDITQFGEDWMKSIGVVKELVEDVFRQK